MGRRLRLTDLFFTPGFYYGNPAIVMKFRCPRENRSTDAQWTYKGLFFNGAQSFSILDRAGKPNISRPFFVYNQDALDPAIRMSTRRFALVSHPGPAEKFDTPANALSRSIGSISALRSPLATAAATSVSIAP